MEKVFEIWEMGDLTLTRLTPTRLPPTGCAFHPRCPHVNERCRAERPQLLTIQGVKIACHAVEEERL